MIEEKYTLSSFQPCRDKLWMPEDFGIPSISTDGEDIPSIVWLARQPESSVELTRSRRGIVAWSCDVVMDCWLWLETPGWMLLASSKEYS